MPVYAGSPKQRAALGYCGPVMRVKLSDGRHVDVYDDDPAIAVPPDALRFGDLESNPRLLFCYDQD